MNAADVAYRIPHLNFQFPERWNVTSGAAQHDLRASFAEHPPDTSRQRCASTFAYLSLLQKFIEPRQRSLKRIDAMLGLAQAMAFAWITNEDSFDATTTQRHVHLQIGRASCRKESKQQ